MPILQGEVYWVNLDPTLGSEIKKTRLALVISPNDLNQVLPRVIIAPITSKGQPLGCRPELVFKTKPARILLDQLRTVDKRRLGKKIGEIDLAVWQPVLLELFA